MSAATFEIPDLGRVRCEVPAGISPAEGADCILETPGGHECARFRGFAPEGAGADAGVSFLRVATPEDESRQKTNLEVASRAFRAFAEQLAKLRLPAQAAQAHFSFRRERLTLWYVADRFCDVRGASSVLQRQFATKVDARWLGPREAAALVGGLGTCGRKLCCACWLKKFEAVTIPMANAQRVTLANGAANGMCGRLRCCIRFEAGANP